MTKLKFQIQIALQILQQHFLLYLAVNVDFSLFSYSRKKKEMIYQYSEKTYQYIRDFTSLNSEMRFSKGYP